MSHNYCEYIKLWSSLIKKIFKLESFLGNLAQSVDPDVEVQPAADLNSIPKSKDLLS